jgi:putative FmdB family regulatory protein
MPIYEYECETCGEWREEHFFPAIPRTVPETIVSACPVCGETGGTFKKVMSVPNFHLKGNCWAKDGYTTQYQDGSRVVAVQGPDHPENPQNPNRR